MDAKQYEDLKREYIRRKMAHADKMEKGNDEETSNSLFGGDSTRQTEANDEETKSRGRGVFGRAMDLIFTEQKNERYAEGVQLSTKDLMWRGSLEINLPAATSSILLRKVKAFTTNNHQQSRTFSKVIFSNDLIKDLLLKLGLLLYCITTFIWVL